MKTERASRAGGGRRRARAGEKKLTAPVTLFALRAIAFAERRSLADVVREAVNTFLAQHPAPRRLVATER